MKIFDVAQGTSAWLALRAGIPTASMFSNIITPGGKKSESQEAYMNHLLAERILGRPIDGFKSSAMEDGNTYEKNCIAAYEFEHNVTTVKIGFIKTDDERIGCSPDSFIQEHPEGMVEAKAPTPKVQVSYLRASTGASKEYRVQLQGELFVCEKEWVDICAYAPGFPDAVFRVYRDEEFIKELSAHVRAFSGRLEDIAEDFKARGWIKDKADEQEPELDASFLNDADMQWALSREYPEVQ